MKKYISCFFVLVCLLTVQASAMQNPPVFFGYTPENQRFLRYWFYTNEFDSAGVYCWFGEVRVNGQPVLLKQRQMFQLFMGDPAPGLDNTLANNSKTASFIMPEGGNVSFFRKLVAQRIPCGMDANTPKDNGCPGGWEGDWWKVGPATITDKTEFVLKLYDEDTGNPIATLDSVGVAPNPGSVCAGVYGTEHTKMFHTVALPSGFSGRKVYLRFEPRRWGPTPLGIMQRVLGYCLSLSAVEEYLGKENGYLTPEQTDSLQDIYFNLLIAYMDSVKAATGCIPKYDFGFNLDDDQHEFWVSRYATKRFSANEYMIECETPIGKQADEPEVKPGNTTSTFTSRTSVQAHVNSNSLVVDVNTGSAQEGELLIYNLEGQQQASLWRGRTPVKQLHLPLDQLANGVYFLRFVDKNGRSMAGTKVVVTK